MPYKDKEKQKQFQREWVAKRRAEWFKDKKCALCNSTEELELDHIDPSKKWKHRIWSYCVLKREAELLKCQVLCNHCHTEKTKIDRKYKRWGNAPMPYMMADAFTNT